MTKIDGSCQEMDGNTSNGDEELLVETIKEEMPTKLEQVQECIEEIAELEGLISTIRRTAQVDGLNEAKGRTDKVNS